MNIKNIISDVKNLLFRDITNSEEINKEENIDSKNQFLTAKPESAENKNFKEIFPPNLNKSDRDILFCSRDNHMQSNHEAYFKNGELYDVKPRNRAISLDEDRQTAYDARYIISDGIKYDLEDPESIKSMKIPKFNDINGMPYVTRDLGYIMKIKGGANNNTEAIIPSIYKAVNLMMASPIFYGKRDYYQLIKELWRNGEFEYGNYLEEALKKQLPFMTNDNFIHEETFDIEMNFAKEHNLDLIEIGNSNCSCGECAKYKNRVYSISGRSKNFPKLPQHIIENKGLHCRNSISVCCLYGKERDITIQVNKYSKNGDCKLITVNAIKYSKRPFVDDRNSFEKENYEKHKEEYIKKKQAEESYYSFEYWKTDYYKHLEYKKIVELLGDKAPKSYSGYRRMKKNNTKNFQKISELATSNGIQILEENIE